MTKQEELIWDIIEQAKKLTNTPIDELRLLNSTDDYGSLHAAHQEFAGVSKGELVEIALETHFLLN